ncbi:hypothetical protein M0R19_04295 [Candidatus Pacearchaeota archaeon]|nr:hypothetical protein [Candidatus Pacearchaeota archaeon]
MSDKKEKSGGIEVLEVIQAINQVAYENGFKGSGTLKNGEEVPVIDEDVYIPWSVKMSGNKLCILIHEEVAMKEAHETGFENNIKRKFSQVIKHLKRQFKDITKKELNLKEEGDMDIKVQLVSMVRAWYQAKRTYIISNIKEYTDNLTDTPKDFKERQKKFKDFLSQGEIDKLS